MPALKRQQWKVEVPIYFFFGGLAGAASVIGTVGQFSSSDRRLVRNSRWMAAIGGLISPALLISDLGVPSRFLNMLRVFKIQSPMSVGSWTLVAFSNSAAAAAVLGELEALAEWSGSRSNQRGANCFRGHGNDSFHVHRCFNWSDCNSGVGKGHLQFRSTSDTPHDQFRVA